MLTELQVKNARPKDKHYMMRDNKGLYLRVDTSGNKYWILRYWEQKKEHQISLGSYPDLPLKDARIKRDEIHTARAKGESLLSTIANEHGINRDVIERQLAHVEGNSVRVAYNHAEYMLERVKLVQWWADYLNGLAEKK